MNNPFTEEQNSDFNHKPHHKEMKTRSTFTAIEQDCGFSNSCEGYKMIGSYMTHLPEYVKPQRYSENELKWETTEFVDIAVELDFPKHLNTHSNNILVSFGFENNNFTEIGPGGA
jgi:hypothetical protein